MKISTWKNFVIGILVVLNLAALSTIWFGHRTIRQLPGTEHWHRMPNEGPDPGPGDRNPEPPPVDMVIIRMLDLDDDQLEAFKALKDEHHERSVVLHNEIRDLKQNSFKAISNGDKAEAERIADEVGRLHAEMELMLYDHFSDIRALCNDQQRERFDELLTRIGERIHPGPPQGRRPLH